MPEEVSKIRLYLLRAFYLLMFVGFGSSIWPTIIDPGELWVSLEGVAFSFWAAFSLLCGLGILHPLKMLPLLFIQLFYKSIWLLAVGLQLWSANSMDAAAQELAMACAAGVIIDLLIIPWPYVLKNYLLRSKEQKSH